MSGIETLKGVIRAGASLVKAVDKALDDGKMTWFEGLGMIGELKEMAIVITHRKQIAEEWNDLDDSEREALNDYFAEKLDLRDDQKEIFVEKCFEAVMSLADAYDSLTDLKDEESPSTSSNGGSGQGPTDPDPD